MTKALEMEAANLQKQLFTDRNLRTGVTSHNHEWFFSTYFAPYITYKSAKLHKSLFAITEDEENPLSVVVAFRGSGKSTIMTLSYPIWAVLGKQQKKFVLIASQTQYQARVHLTNIKRELESNELLKNDMGPFVEQREEWGSTSLYIPKYNARITAISTEQSVRGIRHGRYRPDLIIADDVEDMASVKTREGRNKTFDWYTSEIIPAGDTSTKRIAVGNLLHEDSLLMRLIERIEQDEIDGIYKRYPLIDDTKNIAWPAKFPDMKAITREKRKIGNRVAWEREYLLNIIPDEDQIIDPKWINFYSDLPEKTKETEYINSFISVDLAISQKATADKTAIIVVHVFGYKDSDRRYFVDKQIINKRLTHLQTLEAIDLIYRSLDVMEKTKPMALIEQVAYQASVVEHLKDRDIEALGVKIHADKRARIQLASSIFEQGKVYLPSNELGKSITQQLTGFGVEKHDDLADAMSMAVNYIQTKVKWQCLSMFYMNGLEDVIESWGIKYLD